MVLVLLVQIDGQVDPVSRRRNLIFTIVPNIFPIVAEKHLDHVPIPQSPARPVLLRRQEKIQRVIGADEKEIDVCIGPERFYFSLYFG